MIKTTAKNLRVTLSRKHLTRSRNQIRATKSLPSKLRTNRLLSETDFFLNKEGDITPPPPPPPPRQLTVLNLHLQAEQACISSSRESNQALEKPTKSLRNLPSLRTKKSPKSSEEEIRYVFKTSGKAHKTIFFGLRRHQRRDFFSRVPDVTPSRRPDIFLVRDVTKR